MSEALAGPQIRARNPRTAIRSLSGLVTVFRVHLGRTQGPGLSFTRKQDLGSRSWRNPQGGTEDSASYFTGLGRVWRCSGFSWWAGNRTHEEEKLGGRSCKLDPESVSFLLVVYKAGFPPFEKAHLV